MSDILKEVQDFLEDMHIVDAYETVRRSQELHEKVQAARAQSGQGAEPVSPGDPLPCPFCGSTDVGGAGGTVGCYRCPAEIAVQNANTAYAVELWNNRVANHPQPAQQGSVPEAMTALVAICQHLRDYVDNRGTSIVCDRGVNHFLDALKQAEQALSTTPQPEGDGWVRCSERLPEQLNREYLVHVNSQIHSRPRMFVAEYNEYGFDRSKVTHWMPLPQPPREGE